MISTLGKDLGGTSEVVPRICEALAARSNEVRIITTAYGALSDSAECAIEKGVEIFQYPASAGCFGRVLRYSTRLKADLDRHIAWADVVHIHGLWQLPGWMSAKVALRRGKPYVMMPHGFLEPERLKISRYKKWMMGRIFDKPILCRANAIVATSESEAEGVRKYGLANPIHIMPIGLDVEKYMLSKCAGKTLLYFSRITPIKGLDMLAEVWGSIDRKGWRLLIVGPDDRGYTAEMKALFAVKCPAESYEFRPPVFGDDKYKLLASADAFVLPTRSENWSIAVAEAMASGLPIVCTKGAPWAIIEKVNAGRWVEISPEAIADGLRQLIRLSDAERARLGANGRRLIERDFGWDKIAGKLMSCYEEVRAREDLRKRGMASKKTVGFD